MSKVVIPGLIIFATSVKDLLTNKAASFMRPTCSSDLVYTIESEFVAKKTNLSFEGQVCKDNYFIKNYIPVIGDLP